MEHDTHRQNCTGHMCTMLGMIRNDHDYAATTQVKRQNCSQLLDIPSVSSQSHSPSLPQGLQAGCAYLAVPDANGSGSARPVFLYSHMGPEHLQSTILMAEQRHTSGSYSPQWKGNEAQVNAALWIHSRLRRTRQGRSPR